MRTFIPDDGPPPLKLLPDEDIEDLYISTLYLFRKVEVEWEKDRDTYSEQYCELKARLRRLEWEEREARRKRQGW